MQLVHFEDLENVFYLDVVKKELASLFGKSKKLEHDYIEWLRNQLDYLQAFGITESLFNKPLVFEKLKAVQPELYSITAKNFDGNPRVLFMSIQDPSESEITILLTVFKEKNTSSDYQHAINVAQKRQIAIFDELR